MARGMFILLALGSALAFGDASAGTGNFLKRPLYAGVICGRADPSCSKFGVAAWVRGRPVELTATVHGRLVRFMPPAGRSRSYWQAFMARDRLRAGGSVRVVLTARFADGMSATVVRGVRIRAGWG
jgi:hypothetical protein